MENTIVALATPPGIAGLAVIRLSGSEALSISDKCFHGKISLSDCKSHTIHYGKIIYENNLIDSVTVSIFKNPNSYTGEDVVEISCHGGMIVSNQIINLLIHLGANPALPGEFTKRAFLNGRLDLIQVEAVADIIHSTSVIGVKTAARQLEGEFTKRLEILRQDLLDIASLLELELDFADEGLEFSNKADINERILKAYYICFDLSDSFKQSEIFRSGYYVGIAGYPNSGKSTLFNKLLNRKRAIVSDIPGTTRDYLEETLFIRDLTVRLVDTAGLRNTDDIIEIEGIKFVESVLSQSNLIIILNDISTSDNHSKHLFYTIKEKYPDSDILVVQNKIDISEDKESIHDKLDFRISAKYGDGIDELKNYIYNLAIKSSERVQDILINQRHSELLKLVAFELKNACNAIDDNYENEIIAFDIRNATKLLGQITGEIWNDDVLNNIFSKFCIGK